MSAPHPQKLILSIALNNLSIGQVGFNVARELYRRKIQCVIFPKGPVDLSAYQIDQPFKVWLERSINDRYKRFSRDTPTLTCWHISGSEFKPSDRQYLLSFHETDSPTEHEINIVNQQNATWFSSSWSVSNFQQYGGQNVSYIPLGLDEDFKHIAGRLVSDDITHWGLVGKFEELRKLTTMKIQTWVKRYGGNAKHQLTLCVTNPFYRKDVNGLDMNDMYARAFDGKQKPFNVNILPHLKTNVEMNQLYNSFDIDLSGVARSEGWNLPAFTAAALGKWSVVTNCTAHKDWATPANSILIEPTLPMVAASDGVFFAPGQPFSQGSMFDFNEAQLNEAMDRAEKLAKTPNPEGRKLAEQFTYRRTVDEILSQIAADTAAA